MEIGRGDASLMPPPARGPARDGNGSGAAEERPAPSNVHRFPRESQPTLPLEEAGTARFSALLDELLELKSRLAAARRTAGL
jgi:hypothetical protein